MMTADELERLYPFIAWREPVKVTRLDGPEGWACRICIALGGLHGRDIPALPRTSQQVAEHIAREHPPGAEP